MTSLARVEGVESLAISGLRRFAGRAILGVFAIAISGCAMLDTRPPEEIVKERAQARWSAMVKGDMKVVYDYLSPGSRAVVSAEAYASQFRVGFWKAAEVDKVDRKSVV